MEIQSNKIIDNLIREKGISWIIMMMISYVKMMPREKYIISLQNNLEKTLAEYQNRYKDEQHV